jgi:hypothetical protein
VLESQAISSIEVPKKEISSCYLATAEHFADEARRIAEHEGHLFDALRRRFPTSSKRASGERNVRVRRSGDVECGDEQADEISPGSAFRSGPCRRPSMKKIYGELEARLRSFTLCLTIPLFAFAGREHAFPLGFMASQRNVGLMLPATGGALPDLTWLYFAFCYFPIYLSPLLLQPLLRQMIVRTIR